MISIEYELLNRTEVNYKLSNGVDGKLKFPDNLSDRELKKQIGKKLSTILIEAYKLLNSEN